MPENGKMVPISEKMVERGYAYSVNESVSTGGLIIWKWLLTIYIHLQVNDSKQRIYCEQYPS